MYNLKADEVDQKQVKVLDIGCGYGGLLYALSELPEFSEKLMLGMEIRDKVSNYCTERINSIRINSDYTKQMNISVLRTNVMKTILNYFQKGQIEKMFFCFADPHFK